MKKRPTRAEVAAELAALDPFLTPGSAEPDRALACFAAGAQTALLWMTEKDRGRLHPSRMLALLEVGLRGEADGTFYPALLGSLRRKR